jgi:hypothetical protein
MNAPRVLLLVVAVVLSGCASATGPLYPNVSGSLTSHPGNATVLVYWPSKMWTGDSGYFLFLNDATQPKQLLKGGFYSSEVAPGPLDVAFSMSPNKGTVGGEVLSAFLPGLTGGPVAYGIWHNRPHIDIDVVARQTYYVRLSKAKSGPSASSLESVPQNEAEGELQDCHWINSR